MKIPTAMKAVKGCPTCLRFGKKLDGKKNKKDRGKPSTDRFDNAKRRASIYEVSLNLRLLSGFQSYRNSTLRKRM